MAEAQRDKNLYLLNVKVRKDVAEGAKDWQQKNHLQDSFIKIVRHLQCGGIDKQCTTTNEEPL